MSATSNPSKQRARTPTAPHKRSFRTRDEDGDNGPAATGHGPPSTIRLAGARVICEHEPKSRLGQHVAEDGDDLGGEALECPRGSPRMSDRVPTRARSGWASTKSNRSSPGTSGECSPTSSTTPASASSGVSQVSSGDPISSRTLRWSVPLRISTSSRRTMPGKWPSSRTRWRSKSSGMMAHIPRSPSVVSARDCRQGDDTVLASLRRSRRGAQFQAISRAISSMAVPRGRRSRGEASIPADSHACRGFTTSRMSRTYLGSSRPRSSAVTGWLRMSSTSGTPRSSRGGRSST